MKTRILAAWAVSMTCLFTACAGYAQSTLPSPGDTLNGSPLLSIAPPARIAPHEAAHPAKMLDRMCARPLYPPSAARAGATGVTRVRLLVDPSGTVTDAEVLVSAGATREHKLLDAAALGALRECTYQPATDQGGHAVSFTHDMGYTWRLQ